ncbi:hypothetical protein LJR186_001215 [Microbacterium foliorum]
MASKKELQAKLDDLAEQNKLLLTEVQVHESRQRARQRRDHEAEQQRLREAEHRARRENLDRLGEGLLSLKKRTRWAIVNEEGETGIEVFVPLDQEEQRVALGYLNGKPASNAVHVPSSLIDQFYTRGGIYPRRAGIFPHLFV